MHAYNENEVGKNMTKNYMKDGLTYGFYLNHMSICIYPINV